MENYINKLKIAAGKQETSGEQKNEQREKMEVLNPSVVCSVTLGKELHAGHMFLISVAEQVRAATDSSLPIIVINNNTGPRAAGSIVALAEQESLSLIEAAKLMNSGYLTPEQVVFAYRNRKEKSSQLPDAMRILATGEYDIFASISEETERLLSEIGFNTKVVSESVLVNSSGEKTRAINPNWMGSGFTPFSDSKRLVILEKGGSLTATGTMLTSITNLSERLNSDMVFVVDSMADSQDASFVFSEAYSGVRGLQVPGAGVGFDGMLASGSKGEALTLSEIANSFYTKRPNGNLRDAALYFTLKMPVSLPGDTLDLTQSFYDFYDNNSLIEAIIASSDELEISRKLVSNKVRILQEKISDISSASGNSASKLIEFLPQRSQALFQSSYGRDISASKKVDIIPPDQIGSYLEKLGYNAGGVTMYDKGFRKLAVRKNYYLSYLNGLLTTIDNIETLKAEDFEKILKMVEICIRRVGL